MTSPVKLRMLYSSGMGSLVQAIQHRLGVQQRIAKRIELSDPNELSENFIRVELGYRSTDTAAPAQEKGFARPKAPKRQR